MIKPGDPLPDANLFETLEFGEACPLPPQPIKVAEAAKGKRIVIFGLPGAYTPTCSAKHVPGYVKLLPELKAKGVDEVWCVSVNDGYVMAEWGRQQGAIGKLRMLGDPHAELAKKLGLEIELPGLGVRLKRCSLLVKDGVVEQVNVEPPREFGVSTAEHMLKGL